MAENETTLRPVWDGRMVRITRPKGPVPDILRGKYTSIEKAQEAIDFFFTPTIKHQQILPKKSRLKPKSAKV